MLRNQWARSAGRHEHHSPSTGIVAIAQVPCDAGCL